LSVSIDKLSALATTPPCPCGSGLSAVHCCDFDTSVRTPVEDFRPLIAVAERAVAAWRSGDRDAAERLCRDVLERAPDRPGVLRVLCEICHRPVELLEKGRLLDRLGRYDDAWANFMAGKERARELSGNHYPQAEMSAFAERLKRFFTRERLALLPRAGRRADVPQPIFVVGFPRSGTTLLEQTLSASPAICAGDELPLIHDLVGIMPRLLDSPLSYPEALSELWMADQREGLDNLRDYYLQKVRQMGVLRDGARWFTDKMPLNEVHLGLIALTFPQAPIVHVVRHPLDVMVSAMSNLFTHGRFCASSLEAAAKHLILVSDLVEHYRREIDLRYLPARYEDVVDDQEATIRRVFDFVGAPFDPDTLHFENNTRYARTASYAQVTDKLYDKSRFRYRNYHSHLKSVIPMQRPLIERMAYTVQY